MREISKLSQWQKWEGAEAPTFSRDAFRIVDWFRPGVVYVFDGGFIYTNVSGSWYRTHPDFAEKAS